MAHQDKLRTCACQHVVNMPDPYTWRAANEKQKCSEEVPTGDHDEAFSGTHPGTTAAINYPPARSPSPFGPLQPLGAASALPCPFHA